MGGDLGTRKFDFSFPMELLLQRVLWIVSNVPYFLGAILLALVLIVVWWNKRHLRRTAHPREAAA